MRLVVLAWLSACFAGCGPVGDPPRPAPASPAERVVARLSLAGTPVEPTASKPGFVLTDTSGQPFALRERTDGYWTLLFFGYTHCPDICPVHLANVAAALDKAPPEVRRSVRVVFVGVDPERDTPERMRAWLDHFSREFIGLTGGSEALRDAQTAAGVSPAFVDERWEEGYSVSHAGWITLYSPDGQARLRYPFGTRQREWAHDLETLVREGWPAGS